MPCTVRAEPRLEPVGVSCDLADAVARGDHRQDRLVERPADDLDPAGCDQAGQAIDIFAVPLVEPFHQRPAGVQRDRQIRVGLEDVQERQVAVLIGLLEDAVEVADRLVVVQDQAKANANSWCEAGVSTKAGGCLQPTIGNFGFLS